MLSNTRCFFSRGCENDMPHGIFLNYYYFYDYYYYYYY